VTTLHDTIPRAARSGGNSSDQASRPTTC